VTSYVVLVVEDNPITLKMLRFALQIEGLEVLEAPTGKAALAVVAVRRPDLLVLDYILPDTDGLRLAAEVRRRCGAPDLPAIVVTGMVSRLVELRAEAGPSTQFLAKPVEPSRLLEVVRGGLEPPSAPPSGRRVLVVDDDLLNRKLASFHLRGAGYEVEVVATAAEALDRARRNPPDAILCDVMMPAMDGFDFCRAVRGEPGLGALPVVLVSSTYVDHADRELARRVGATALVTRTPDLKEATSALHGGLCGELAAAAPEARETVLALHHDRLRVQLERQAARNETLLRQGAIQATALSIIRGLSEVLAQPKDITQILADVLVHCLDAAGLSTGLLYSMEADGRHRLQALFGVPIGLRVDAEGCFGHPELMQKAVEERQSIALSTRLPDTTPETRDFLARLGHTSALILPFVVLGETYGELVLASDSHDLADSAWIGFARSLALQFGQTVALGQSLKRMAASEGRYRALMEQAQDAIMITDIDARIVEVNAATERLLGRPRERILGQTYVDLVIPAERAEVLRGWPKFVAESTMRISRRRFLGSDREVPMEVSASLVRVGDEEVAFIVLRDITERERAEAALQQAQQRLQHVVSSSPAVLYALKMPEGGPVEGGPMALTWISENLENLLGYTVAEALAIPDWWLERLHPLDRDRVLEEVVRVVTEGALVHEYRFLDRGGVFRWVRAEMRLQRGADGTPLEAIGSWSDVSARKEAELRLAESEEQYRLLFESNPFPMSVVEAETHAFLAVNDASVRHYGYTRAEFAAMRLEDVRLPLEPGAAADLGVAHAARHRKKDGTVFDVEVAATPLVFRGRRAWLALVSDITEKRSLEAQLLQAQKMESMGRLAGGVAHDFNNLLGIITGYAGLLRRRVAQDARLNRYVEDILKAAERAAGLTRQLLAFGRKQVLQPRVLHLNAVVDDTQKMLRRLIGEDITLVTALDPDLGVVRADPGQMEQVLMNLAVNARDAMPRGGRLTIETANVELDAAYTRNHAGVVPGGYVMLAVTDTGVGMPPEVKARLFEPFFTTKDPGKGTGLGLATVHGIVTQSGGHVWVYSELGHGTSFKVYLPRADAGASEAAAELPSEVEAPRGTETILLVEDEASLRELVRECLEAAGYTVLEGRHGAEGLHLCATHDGAINLLMTDVIMPGMSGRELAEEVLRQRPEARVLYMSGYTDDAVVVHGVVSAEVAFLQKPFTAASLARTVREALDRPPEGAG
jgi:PAS domain S-box-containing protein